MIKQNQLNKVLFDILEKNKDTEYGRRYHFDYLRTVDGFRNTVPLTKYEDISPLVELTTRIGEQNIFTSDRLAAYALTSGTSDINHFVPCTDRHIMPYIKEFIKTLADFGDNVVLFESIPKKIIYSDQARLNTITGILLQEVRGDIPKLQLTTPEALLFREDPADITYYRTLFAVRSRRVSQITTPFTWSVMSLVRCITENRDRLINDLKTGRVTFDDRISDELKKAIQDEFKPNKARAAELEKAFSGENYDGLLTRVWPRLKKIVASGTGRFEIYRDNLERYLGGAKLVNGYFGASEAIIGKSVAGGDTYKLCTADAYFEFKDITEPGTDTVLYDEVETGKQYSIYVTNYAGLYRYRIGDIVEITGMEDGVPIFKYVRRTNEKISEKLIYEGIKKIAAEFGTVIEDFCFDKTDKGLSVYLEAEDHEKIKASTGKALTLFDEGLKVCDIKLITPGTQEKYKRIRAISGNMAADQLKPVRLLDDEKRAFFDLFVIG